MRSIALLWLILAAAASAADAVRPDHPIIGTWTHTLPNGCSEVYTFTTDGMSHVLANAEISESRYTISDHPNTNGYYTHSDTIVSNNGLLDCTGHTTPVGDKAEIFVRFTVSGNRMLICYTEKRSDCFGPLKRVKTDGSEQPPAE